MQRYVMVSSLTSAVQLLSLASALHAPLLNVQMAVLQ